MDMTNFGTVDYTNTVTPPGYVCHCCGAVNVKLWRQYQTFLDHQNLFCTACAAKEQDIDISTMTPKGTYTSGITKAETDSIGWRIPAVPTEQGDTFWGYRYTSVPQEGCIWWQRLPVSKKD